MNRKYPLLDLVNIPDGMTAQGALDHVNVAYGWLKATRGGSLAEREAMASYHIWQAIHSAIILRGNEGAKA